MADAEDDATSHGGRWGEGAARCFSLEGNVLDEQVGIRLQPIPDNFICPISAAIMDDPVATIDGNVYEREYIERWIWQCQQRRQPPTSPFINIELNSANWLPMLALKRAIEVYIANRLRSRRRLWRSDLLKKPPAFYKKSSWRSPGV